jgi:hypothetical protein
MANSPLDGDDLKEIAKGMLGEDGRGVLPGSKLCKGLGKATNRTEEEVRDVFRLVYKDLTETDDDPFVPPPPIMG